MKYCDVLTTYALQKKLDRLPKDVQDKILDTRVVVTEKIDGENFRIGIDEGGEYIGQHKEIFYRAVDGQFLSDEKKPHPRWHQFSPRLMEEIVRVLEFEHEIIDKGHISVVLFGELYGNGLQKGVFYEEDGYNVVWFDAAIDSEFIEKDRTNTWLLVLHLNGVPYVGTMSLQEFVDFDPLVLKPKLAKEGHAEGIVGVPIQSVPGWTFMDRLIVKNKVPEKSEGVKPVKKEIYESPFEQFVDKERLRHVMAAFTETGREVTELKECRNELVSLMIVDIEKEANDHNSLPINDKKIVMTRCHQLLSEYYRNPW
jgi:hypothetical protein